MSNYVSHKKNLFSGLVALSRPAVSQATNPENRVTVTQAAQPQQLSFLLIKTPAAKCLWSYKEAILWLNLKLNVIFKWSVTTLSFTL